MSYQPLIAPSILSADFARLDREIERIPAADWIHVDVMDGHFVPNLSFGAPVAKAVGEVTDKPMDCHLMIEDPARWVGDYVDAGAASITFHVEATDDPRAVADLLHSRGCRAGISLKPGTAVEPYLDLLEHVDLVLVMSVEPGFGGQSFMPEVLDKVRTLRAEIDRRGLDVLIQIDGGIDSRTIGDAASAGCDVFVAGSAVYGAPDPDAMIETLRAGAADARA
ncbi:MAG: ribulose-phosphate 3-epimerase [Dietzia sp.]|uniref:Ribulose-phosphate 3-epimerase n=1 Tax=Dietzia cercidiphylli TaxID=498199 RepID=A0ABN2HZY5_9ACTN|nr:MULTISPECIES: ribulose-phosphate 3-epimerase [Dietzia]MBB1032969.1 ribulose-phosphate 3-epimerase [Dietzia sp. CQ4]MBB1037317.1 ribulose-phosphate 3-epimerase [Dietzia natronolimnaea]MBB1046323.1 ribulose-phosphate 3-epimerase [Dietzia cercidiphylli]MBB1052046.1 ribulose-phosphate 3-epimerase [Dietzia sp. CW19]MDO8392772.1 ribulose-phosphate 3-epimerase [Dietzia sp.]